MVPNTLNSIRILKFLPNLDPDPGLESIKKSSTLESSTLAISTLYLEGEGRDHTCAVSDVPVPFRVELYSFTDSSPGLCYQFWKKIKKIVVS